MRRGVGIWQAIMIILIVSGIMMIALKYSSISAKHTADTYVREQAELFLNSAVEIAMLQISGYDRSGGDCLENVHIESPGAHFVADVTMEKYYLFSGTCSNVTTEVVTTEESHGYVMMNVVVTSTKSLNPVRIERRTLQHP